MTANRRLTPCELYRLGLEEPPAASGQQPRAGGWKLATGGFRIGSATSELALAAPLLVGGLLVVGSLALSKRKAGFGR